MGMIYIWERLKKELFHFYNRTDETIHGRVKNTGWYEIYGDKLTIKLLLIKWVCGRVIKYSLIMKTRNISRVYKV